MRGVWLTIIWASVCVCYGPHHPRGPHKHYKPSQSRNTKLTQDYELIHDKMHIKEDLSAWATNVNLGKISSDELAFYYFRTHDFDKNTKLDGLEILQAIRHAVHEQKENSLVADVTISPEDLEYYIELIDKVLKEDDLDGDGFLSYVEFSFGRGNIKIKL